LHRLSLEIGLAGFATGAPNSDAAQSVAPMCRADSKIGAPGVPQSGFAFAAVWNIFPDWIGLKIRGHEQGIHQDRRRA
jgi:hypothetical protein